MRPFVPNKPVIKIALLHPINLQKCRKKRDRSELVIALTTIDNQKCITGYHLATLAHHMQGAQYSLLDMGAPTGRLQSSLHPDPITMF